MSNMNDNCPSENHVSSWKRKLLIIMRLSLVIFGVLIVIFGTVGMKVFGVMTLIAVTVIYIPAILHPRKTGIVPVEVEILFLTVVALEYILGNTLGFYGRIAHYDNFMHFTIPFIVALIGMMFLYTAYVYGKLKTNLFIMAFLIIFVTLGIGALLEIVEYGYDQFLYHHIEHFLPTGPTQGSPTQNALDDTMNDLLTDLVGGILGAVTGIVLIKRAEKKNYCLEWVDEIADFEGIKKG